jgi:hypothetical protein
VGGKLKVDDENVIGPLEPICRARFADTFPKTSVVAGMVNIDVPEL